MITPPRLPSPRKILIASLGTATVLYAASCTQSSTSGNLVPPPPPADASEPETGTGGAAGDSGAP